MSVPTRSELASEVRGLHVILRNLVDGLRENMDPYPHQIYLKTLTRHLQKIEKEIEKHRADVLYPDES